MATTSCGLSRRHALLLATTVLMSGLAAPALAQSSAAVPPVRQTIDENGVDVLRGTITTSQTAVSIGPDWPNGLAYKSQSFGTRWTNLLRSSISLSGSSYLVTVEGASDGFTLSGGVFTPTEGSGGTLTQSGTTYTYTSRSGVIAVFEINTGGYAYWDADRGRAISITYPSGVRVNFYYRTTLYCPGGIENGRCPAVYRYALRLQSVTNTNGYQLKLTYASNILNDSSLATDYNQWSRLTSVKAINNAVEYCAPNLDSCTLTNAWPEATFGQTATQRTITDTAGRTTRYTLGGSARLTGIKRPGAATDNVTVGYTGIGDVQSVTRDGVTDNYAYADSGSTRTTTVTDPNSGTRVYVGSTTTFLLSSFKDELNRTTAYSYDGNGRVTDITYPEGNKSHFVYDTRGNVTEARSISKTPGTPPDIVTTAVYPATCTTTADCNKPTSTTDARGNTTDYTYNSGHGGVLTATAPAPTSGAVRPQTRYSYVSRQGYYKDATSSIVASGAPTSVLATVSACRTTASCAGGADEVKTTIDYGPQTSGTANNLLPVSTTTGAGDGSLTATTAVTYDVIGNPTYVDGPLSGSADTSRTLYDAARQVVGAISPDPDGGGSLPNRAQRITYNSDGQVTVVERGTTAGQSDSAWSGFSAAEKVTSIYDANARKTKNVLGNGSTDYGVTQYSYDALGRPECSAVRMNSAIWSSLPASACAAGTTGSFGPDRIGKTIYDAASQVTKIQTAVGTADVTDEATLTYTSNGRLSTVSDGNNNRTTYEYDGFDRVTKTRYPSSTVPGTSSTTDYEQPTYDASGNIMSLRLRDGQSIAYTHDNLNRVIAKDVPNIIYWDLDLSYTYDLFGRVMTVANGAGDTITLSYDALGRQIGDVTSWLGSKSMQYDLAGRMSRLTYTDGFYVDYDRLVTGEVSKVRENGATSGVGVLGSYTYDNLGRRTVLYRGNATQTDYAYDPVSRLTTLTNNLGATAHDVTATFSYNPAGQIASSTRNNDAYAFPAFANKDAAETANGLNQLTQQASTTLGYDGRGNASTIGGTTYAYTSENRLATVSGGLKLRYDPAGRLFNVESSTPYYFDYTGDRLTSEVAPGGAIQRRYVHGPGEDEVLTWYEGSGMTDRRWLYQDERGSVTAIANASGNATALNSYDDYGTPAAANTGRFGYTGQAWLPELGMWYYKARMYAPTLGRFLQTDPIGYGGGMNLYAYVGGDPVNLTDPSGLYPGQKCYAKNPGNRASTPGVEGQSLPNDIIVTGTRPCPESNTTDLIIPRGLEIFNQVPNIRRAESGLGTPQNMQPQTCPIAYTPQGDTKGENPRPGSGRYNTDLPGGFQDAWKVFSGLSRLAGEPSYTLFPSSSFSNATTLAVSQPSGSVRLRVGVDYLGGARVGFSPRIDIKAGTFDLKVAETIHFTGGKGNMCPTR